MEDEALIIETTRTFNERVSWRSTFAIQWEETAQLIWSECKNTFMYGNYNFPGMKKTERQVDSSGVRALSRYKAICHSLTTPKDQQWQQIVPGEPDLMKDRGVRLFFERLTHHVFQKRYAPLANFDTSVLDGWKSYGAFGNTCLFIEALKDRTGPRYERVPLSQCFWAENDEGIIDDNIRWMRWTARKIYKRWPDTFPETLKPALESNSEQVFDILHWVRPRDDYDPERIFEDRGKPFVSVHVCLQSKSILQKGGYYSFPFAVARDELTDNEVFGRGAAQRVLPTLKTLNGMKRAHLKTAHRVADPTLLLADDGILDFDQRPGATNKGGMTQDGHALVGVLPTGDVKISLEMMQEERGIIDDEFFVSLFQILMETPQMTATEVVQRVAEKGVLLAPALGRLQTYIQMMTHRELDIMDRLGLLPPADKRVVDAIGQQRGRWCKTVDASPLGRHFRAGELAGARRSLEFTREWIAITGDVSAADNYNIDKITVDGGRIDGMPESWFSTPQEVAQKRKSRAKSQAMQEQIQMAPAQAALIKAHATMAKAGVAPQQQGQDQQQMQMAA